MSAYPAEGRQPGRPGGVLLVELLLYVGAAFELLAGAVILVATALSDVAPDLEDLELGLAIFLILVGLFNFVLARAIGQGQEWARVVYVALQFLAALGGIVTLVEGYARGIIFFLIPLFLIWLLFTPSAERYFEDNR